MKEVKHQVFISSTFIDLKDERQAAVTAILNSHNIPAGMELFTANNISQWEIIQRWIKECDIYMLILGGRYGSIDAKTQLSYTHMEYRFAKSLGKPIFAIIISESKLKKIKIEKPNFIEKDNPEKLTNFRSEVKEGLVREYDDLKDIEIHTARAIAEIENDCKLIGWIKGDNKISHQVTEELARLSLENNRLKTQINSVGICGLNIEDFIAVFKSKTKNYDEAIKFLLKIGKDLNVGVSANISSIRPGTENYTFLKLFIDLGIVRIDNPNRKVYFFTEDGHKFYLQLLKDRYRLSNQEY